MGRKRRAPPGPPGLILIDKPEGTTSAAATRAVGRRFNLDPVGHTGTLDPAATGLLVVCTGYGTRLVNWLQAGRKGYVAEIRFGDETTTCDREGGVTHTAPVPEDLARTLDQVLPEFMGVISQVPPVFSAVRVDGRRAHALAREGSLTPEELPARTVEIFGLEILAVDADEARVRVICSPGTYIRSLARDIARAMGTAAHLGALRREQTGGFDVADAIGLEALMDLDEPGEHWRRIPGALPSWTKRSLDPRELAVVLNGGAVPAPDLEDDGPVLLLNAEGDAVAVGEREVLDQEGEPRIQVRRLLTDVRVKEV